MCVASVGDHWRVGVAMVGWSIVWASLNVKGTLGSGELFDIRCDGLKLGVAFNSLLCW